MRSLSQKPIVVTLSLYPTDTPTLLHQVQPPTTMTHSRVWPRIAYVTQTDTVQSPHPMRGLCMLPTVPSKTRPEVPPGRSVRRKRAAMPRALAAHRCQRRRRVRSERRQPNDPSSLRMPQVGVSCAATRASSELHAGRGARWSASSPSSQSRGFLARD